MSYQVLARKWRPKSFATLVGQEHVIRALSNALQSQRLHHAYLLTGTRGVGKTTIARILAKSLNCETGLTAEPCGQCDACRQIDAGRFVDLLEIDAASNTGIDNIREVLDNAQYAPTQGRFKVYIIDEVHMLSKSAFNAMLKTLEEPPGHVKFILATTDPQKVPVTVLSRCLQFSLRQMLPQQVTTHLQHILNTEQIPYESAALSLLGHAAAGSMRDALSLLDQAIAYGSGKVEEAGVRAMLGAVDQSCLYALLDCLASRDGAAMMAAAAQLAERGVGSEAALQAMATILHQLALLQTVPGSVAADHPHHEKLVGLAARLTPEAVQLYYQIALHGRRDLALAPDEFAGLSMTLLRMLAFAPTQRLEVAFQAGAPASAVAIPADAAPPAPALLLAPPPSQPIAPDEVEPPTQRQEPSTPVPVAFDGDWPALVAQLKLGGFAGMLAQHAQLDHHADGHFTLAVPDAHKVVAGPDYRDKLAQALSTHLGQSIRVSVTVGGNEAAVPAALQQRERQAQHADAVDAINRDPIVQQLITEFDAHVLPDSIQPRPQSA